MPCRRRNSFSQLGGWLLCALMATALAPAILISDEPAAPKQPPASPDTPAKAIAVERGIALVLVDEQKLSGKLIGFRERKLGIAATEEQWIPLEEIQSLSYVDLNQPVVKVPDEKGLYWLGQDDHDKVRDGAAAEGNGIKDMHFQLRGLPTDQTIKQIIIQCRFAAKGGASAPAQLRVWRLDITGSPHWRLVMERGDNGHAATADLYLEPWTTDAMDQEFRANLELERGEKTSFTCKATSHTSNQAKATASTVQTNTQAPPAAPMIPSEMKNSLLWSLVTLQNKSRLLGELDTIDDASLVIKPLAQEPLSIPIREVHSLQIMALSSMNEYATQFAKLDADPGTEDCVLIRGNEGDHPVTIKGLVKSFANNELKVFYDQQDRGLPMARLTGIVFSAQPRKETTIATPHLLRTIRQESILGRLVDLSNAELTFELPWQGRLKLKSSDVVEVRQVGGRIAYLSDLEPQSVEETPFFGKVFPYQRDRTLSGGALKIKAQQFDKGLAVHSHCVLTYPLDGQFERFIAVAGFDSAVGDKGSVLCRVLADGKELFKNERLTAKGDPATINVSVQGARLLTLEVDFGDNEDTGDRVIFGEARLLRAAGKKES